MKRSLLILIALSISCFSFGALSGLKFIPGDYPTLAAAITDLNSQGVGAGGVIFNVAGGYSESTTVPLLLTATGTSSNPILFRLNPAAPGINPLITRTDAGTVATTILGAQGDAIIIFQGCDYVTFDGIDLHAVNQGIEYGYYLRKVSGTDGCKFVTIKNSNVTMTKGTSGYVAGIYSSNNDPASPTGSATGITVTSVGGRNEGVSILKNIISNVFAGILVRGYNHTVSPYDYQDQNAVIGASNAGNTIMNYAGNVNSASYGVYLIYQTSPTVSFNTISNAGGGGSNATSTLYGIFMSTSNAGGNMAFNNNNITLGQGSTSLANCIHVAPVGTSVTINSNIFSYGTFVSTSTSYLINCNNATPVVTIDGNLTSGLINKTGVGQLECLDDMGSPGGGTLTVSNNNFSNITLAGASPFYGIRVNTGTSQVQNITNNTIMNINAGTSPVYGIMQGGGATGSRVNLNLISNMTGGGAMYAVYCGQGIPVTLDVNNNTVKDLITTGTSVSGIHCIQGLMNSIYKNSICNLKSNNTNGAASGIYIAGGTTNNISNNFVSVLNAPMTTAANPVVGLNIQGGSTANVFFNSVNLYATSSGAVFGSSALFASTTVTLDLRNNILINKSAAIGGGYTVAYRRSTTNLATYANTSNNNDLYAGIPSLNYVLFYDGTNAFSTLAAYQLWVGPVRDASSFSEDPPFVLTPSCDLHMQTTVPTLCESGGVQVLLPFPVTDDIDGDPRAMLPDVGADEFAGLNPRLRVITGFVNDTLGTPVPAPNLYMMAYLACNPSDTLTTLNGGITIDGGGGGGGSITYTLHLNNFLNPPASGDQVFLFFQNIETQEFSNEVVSITPDPIIYCNTIVLLNQHVHLPFKTSSVKVVIPPHKTLMIHYTYVNGCGNTDVFEWNGLRWVKFRQWNWNHYCTWRYIRNDSDKPKVYVIHNDDGNIYFDLAITPVYHPTTPSNGNEFAVINFGWRDRPHVNCEFGNINSINYTFIDGEGTFLDQFPARLGTDGVQNLTIQFESYDNIFWQDMQLMIDLENVTQPGTLELYLPDAIIPYTTASIAPGDTAAYFHTGGVLLPGTHLLTLAVTSGLSIGLDGLIYTSIVPVPDLPSVLTLPVSEVTPTSATSGGTVTSEGGAQVTARGVCWSTSPNPTILDDHTTDGSGPGTYVSVMTPLLPLTNYHYRAYATNLAGTAYGDELLFSTPVEEHIITGIITDSLGMPVPLEDIYMTAYTQCNPDDTLSTLNGGIILDGGGTGGAVRYTIHCNNFLHPPSSGEPVFMSCIITGNLTFDPAKVYIDPGLLTIYDPSVTVLTSVYLGYNTAYTTVDIPAGRTLKMHYTNVYGSCGNTDVYIWNGSSWVFFREWDINQYCTWKYIRNDGSTTMKVKIHNNSSSAISFDLFLTTTYYATSPSNNYLFAHVGLGWRDRPSASCEFADIQGPDWTVNYVEGVTLYQCPRRLGTDGVQNLTIQFECYDNIFWDDMEMMVDLVNVTQPGTLILNVPDADNPLVVATVSLGDTACFFHTGGIHLPGPHQMTLSASGGLSIGLDAWTYYSLVPVPALPVVITSPVYDITSTSAYSGGNVTSEGGAPVTARGICWSTSANPTIIDDHTVDGSGPGEFTSYMETLIPLTTYHLRAYATNLSGTVYGQELIFITMPPQLLITGIVRDTLEVPVPPDNLYIIAYTECNPDDTLTTLNGGIILDLLEPGRYTVLANMFANPPAMGERVFLSFHNTVTNEFIPGIVVITEPANYYDPIVNLVCHVNLPFKTSSIRVTIPPHTTLAIHYTYVNGCGNTDVISWNMGCWSKFRQWNWNHYCTWRYIRNDSHRPQIYVIHNDNGNIFFDMTLTPTYHPTTPSNNNEFALLNFGWRDRPNTSCEFGNIIGETYTYADYEGAPLCGFPSRLGTDGVQNLTIQFESYDNIFWDDMQLMIDLVNVTDSGSILLYIPDATIQYSWVPKSHVGDTVCYATPGGILFPGIHTMTLTATGGLSMGIDGLIFTSLVTPPDVPTVSTLPVTGITSNSAMSGGNVTATGGAPVTARGVCWSLSPSPTILDDHTVDGSGLGEFTSFISPLLPLTNYHVRAYATNLAGTSYGEELTFSTLEEERIITGVVRDSLGIPVPLEDIYMVAYTQCNPTDSLSTLNGGITLDGGGGGGGLVTYTVHCNNFLAPPSGGEPVYLSCINRSNLAFDPAKVIIDPGLVTIYDLAVKFVKSVNLASNTLYTTVDIPPNRTLKVHYTNTYGACGNTDIYAWNGSSWVYFREWDFNQYCTWKYITNEGSTTLSIKIHNNSKSAIAFDLYLTTTYYATSPSNAYVFGHAGLGWRDRPYASCEFADIQAPLWTVSYFEGVTLDQFPQRLGTDGVQNLTIQFECYDNVFWDDMEMMVDLVNVTQPGTLILNIPDADIPLVVATINPGDTACFFHTGGVHTPGLHVMTFTASGGLSMGIDAWDYYSIIPVPALPTVTTAPVTGIASTHATSGGNVVSEGGAPVTARGVCWSISVNPTILDSHTHDGMGPGFFSSYMTPLIPATTYHVRAYATNLSGTVYGQELTFQTLPDIVIRGYVSDSTGLVIQPSALYIIAYTACNPNDTLTTLNGGITFETGGGPPNYVVHCNNFLNPPLPGEQVFLSFHNIMTNQFTPEAVRLSTTGIITIFNPVIWYLRQVHLPYKTAFIKVVIPPHSTLAIHYKNVIGCGNTDVLFWDGIHWIKYRQWNWNHYCMWRYIRNDSNKPQIYVIHNDDGNIFFEMMITPVYYPTTPSNNYEFALVPFGWRDRPNVNCEFGNIVAVNYSFFDFESASLDQFPARLGDGGVQNLTIQFESYDNMFWSDMNLMIDLVNVTQPGTLRLYIPDAAIPLTTAFINPGDTAAFFNTGGIFTPGPHTMILSAQNGLSMGMDAFIYTSGIPVAETPIVTTSPLTDITDHSAVCGGNVIYQGSTPVSARGVCWSMWFNPTILDDHTVDGSGGGAFASFVSPLLPSTMYHARAYATNMAGTSYGEEYIFMTQPEQNKVLDLRVFLEGFFDVNTLEMRQAQDADPDGNTWNKFPGTTVDTLMVQLADAVTWDLLYTAAGTSINPDGTLTVTVPSTFSGDYYIVVKHRSSIETWSANPVSFAPGYIAYDFTVASSQAFGSNQKDLTGEGNVYGLFSGDITSMFPEIQDGYVDIFDNVDVFNNAQSGSYGYMPPDLNGDGYCDIFDMVIVFNNMQNGVGMITPPNPGKKK